MIFTLDLNNENLPLNLFFSEITFAFARLKNLRKQHKKVDEYYYQKLMKK